MQRSAARIMLALWLSVTAMSASFAQSPQELSRVGEALEMFEQALVVPNGDVPLRGWLVLPPGSGPHPVAVLIQPRESATGRSPATRTLAAALVARGVAALSYERRATAEQASPNERADEAAAWMRWLVQRADIDSTGIGVIALSQGDSVVRLLASRVRAPAFVTTMSSSAILDKNRSSVERAIADVRSRVNVRPPTQGSPLRTYVLAITVAPSPAAENEVTFFGSETGGLFLDRNLHAGNWKRDGTSIEWTYTTVPGLQNRFVGRLSPDGRSLAGTNGGTWQGREFAGQFTGVDRQRIPSRQP